MPAPRNSTKKAYGTVTLNPVGHLFDVTEILKGRVHGPLTFEQLSLSNGIVVYQTAIFIRTVCYNLCIHIFFIRGKKTSIAIANIAIKLYM